MKIAGLMLSCSLASLLASVLAGCAGKPPTMPAAAPAPEVVIIAPPRPLPPHPLSKPVARVLDEFNRVEETELHAVTRPRVTPEFVRSVHAAHLEARKAVTELEREKLRPSSAALGHAQAAVSKLGDVLAQVPGDEP